MASTGTPFTQPIDFGKYSYVVEVQVNRSSTSAVPAARTLRIYRGSRRL